MSLYFLVGYLTSFTSVMLSTGVRTPFYSQILEAVQKFPVTSLLIAAPSVVLLGIFVNIFRVAIIRLLIKRQSYNFSALPDILKEALILAIATQLSIDQNQVKLHNDHQFLITKQVLLPEMDEYVIRAHWIHDLFENVVLVASFSLIVLVFRAIVFEMKGLDWVLVLGNALVGLLAIISMPYLRRNYTVSEVSLVTKSHRSLQFQRLSQKDQG